MLRSKRNYKTNTNNFVPYSNPRIIANQKQSSHKDNYEEEQQLMISNIYKENWNCNRRLEHHVHTDQNRIPVILKEPYLKNSIKRHIETRSITKKKGLEGPEESVSIESRRTLRSHNINQVLNKCEKKSFNHTLKNSKNNRKPNNTKTQDVIDINQKKILTSNLQKATRIYGKSKNYNMCKNVLLYNKTLKEHHNETHCKSNVVLQHTSSDVKSLKVQTDKSIRQSILRTNIQNFSNMKSENSKELEVGSYRKCEKQKNIKSTYDIQTRKRKQQKVSHVMQRQHTYKTQGNKYSKKVSQEKGTNSFSTYSIPQLDKTDTKRSKDIVKHENSIGIKKMVIPLIRIDDVPSTEVLKLICCPNYEKQEITQIYHKTKNIKMECFTYKQYTNTELSQDEEINVSYHESVAEEKYTKFETNKNEASSENEDNGTEVLQDKNHTLKTTFLLQNILTFFLNNKNTKPRSTRYSEKMQKYGVRKSVAMCSKCNEVFNLLQQFSHKVNFVQDEKLCIECTLCNLQINFLSQFQHHVMNVHLICEGKSRNRKKKFAINIINFDDQLSSNNNDNIFECSCCSKVFHCTNDFEDHILKIHCKFNYLQNSVKECDSEQIVKTSESYTKYKNAQIFKENCTLNCDLTFDTINNTTEITSQRKEMEIQNDDGISNTLIKSCIDPKEVNLKNSTCCNNLNEIESRKKDKNDVSNSGGSLIINKIRKVKQKRGNLSVNEKCSNNISEITAIAESEISSISNNNINDSRLKEEKKNVSFTCNICLKIYERKKSFLKHMSKHITNCNDNVWKQPKVNKIVNDNKKTKSEDTLIAIKTQAENSQSSILNSITNVEELNQNISGSGIINKETNNIQDENMQEEIIRKNISVESTNDYTYSLHVNLTQKSEKGIKRQKTIKCNINVTKKFKTDMDRQEIMENKIPMNLISNTNFVQSMSEKRITYDSKELHCKICGKRLTSQAMLKKHMFLFHNSRFEHKNLANLSMIKHFNNYKKLNKISKKNVCILRKRQEITKVNTSGKKSHLHKKTINQTSFNKNSINEKSRKWHCSPCKENFALLRNYLRHKYYCHNDKSVVHICDNCNKILTSVAMVNIHICTNVTSWNCKRCNLKFSKGTSFAQHNMNYHFETIGPHVCEVCKSKFLTTYMLEKHKAIHRKNDAYTNLNRFIDSFVSGIPSNVNTNAKFGERKAQLLHDKSVPFKYNSTINSKVLDEINEKFSEMSITFNMSCNSKQVYNCKHCNVLFPSHFQMKSHLEEWHKVELCEICNYLCLTNELTEHLICHHIVSDNLCFKEHNNINIIKILGMKRLLSLYEYQRFDNVLESKCFNCIICSKEFLCIQTYKIHYLQCHDMICLLCNTEFKYSFQAFEHKIKIHRSIGLYLWVVQKLIFGTLQLSKYGSTIEEMILNYSETRI